MSKDLAETIFEIKKHLDKNPTGKTNIIIIQDSLFNRSNVTIEELREDTGIEGKILVRKRPPLNQPKTTNYIFIDEWYAQLNNIEIKIKNLEYKKAISKLKKIREKDPTNPFANLLIQSNKWKSIFL